VIKNAASRRYRPRKNSIKTDTGNRSSLHFDKNLGILIREYPVGKISNQSGGYVSQDSFLARAQGSSSVLSA
jgi:hypothetical protein